MKKTLLVAVAICLTQFLFSQTVSPDSLAKYEGKTITVCAQVVETHVSGGDKKNVTLNFGRPYPKNTFSAFITEGDVANFKNNPAEFYKNKNICITGIVKIYKDKPEVVVTKEEQIKVQ